MEQPLCLIPLDEAARLYIEQTNPGALAVRANQVDLRNVRAYKVMSKRGGGMIMLRHYGAGAKVRWFDRDGFELPPGTQRFLRVMMTLKNVLEIFFLVISIWLFATE